MSKSVRIVCLLVALGWAATAQAQSWYSLSTGGSGGQAQIGGGLPLPIQAATNMATGGKLSMGTTHTPMSAITSMAPIGTGANFPPLLIPVNPRMPLVKQTAGADPKAVTVPVGAFKRDSTAAKILGVALNNPTVYQVRTNINFTGPAPAWGSGMFKKSGRTGAKTTTFTGIPGTPLNPSIARYSGSAARFGGPSRTKVVPNTLILVWAHGPAPGAQPPCKHPAFGGTEADCLALMVHAKPMTLAVAGAAVASPADTTPGGFVMTSGVKAVSVPAVTGMVAMSVAAAMTAPISNMATSSGFPWTTGMLTLSQPNAAATPEVFTITGMDGRVGGVGTLSLVSGALSDRMTSKENANRSWSRYQIVPEPGAVLGAAAALAVLGVCHGLVRRRSR